MMPCEGDGTYIYLPSLEFSRRSIAKELGNCLFKEVKETNHLDTPLVVAVRPRHERPPRCRLVSLNDKPRRAGPSENIYIFHPEINPLVLANKCGIQHSIVTGIRMPAPGVRGVMSGMTSQASLQRRSYLRPEDLTVPSSVSTLEPPWSCLISSCRLLYFVCSPNKPEFPSLHRRHTTDLGESSSMGIFEMTTQWTSILVLKEPFTE